MKYINKVKENNELFDEKCVVTIDGSCKYWKPEEFGYEADDVDAPLDKFFPEQIKSHINKSRLSELQSLVEMVEEMKTRKDNSGTVFTQGFNVAIDDITKELNIIISELTNK